jgi:predicted acylesterase/phospholipase RssA
MRVAWQAGVVRALLEEGLTFAHGDGTSGGIFTLAMLLSGLSPEEMCERWASIDVHDFVSLMPLTEYLKGPTELAAMGDADGLVRRVYPHLGIDVDRVRAAEGMAGTFNVCDFGDKTCVPVPHTEIATELLVAGMSLPLFMPAVTYRGRTWTDAVWIKDANLAEAVRRGAEEVWLAWVHRQHRPLRRRSARAVRAHDRDERQRGAIRRARPDRRAQPPAGGGRGRLRPHPARAGPRREAGVPLPLDPDFYAGRIQASTLVAMGYRDARRYLASMSRRASPSTVGPRR